jgi:hypothetical protein
VRVEIDHTLDGAVLRLDQSTTHGHLVSRLAYYFGGVRLHGDDGRWIAARDDGTDLVLVDARAPDSSRFEALRVSPRAYNAIEFRIGVPPALADGTARGGALDPAHGLFWTWKAGYIFFALEGRAPESAAADHTVFWHAGGDANLQRTIVLPLRNFTVTPGSAPVIHLAADLDALFEGVDARARPTVMEPAQSAPVLDAVSAMFRVDHVHADTATARTDAGATVPVGASL